MRLRCRGLFVVGFGALATGALTFGTTQPSAGASGVSASEKAQAKEAFLVRSDLPKGWSSTKNSDSNLRIGTGIAGADQQLASCLGVTLSFVQKYPTSVTGPAFQSPGDGSDSVSDNVAIFSSASAAKTFVAASTGPKPIGCMQTVAQGPYKSQIFGSPSGSTLGDITFAQVPAGSLPAHTTGLVATIPFTESGSSLTAYATEVVTIKGKLVQQLAFAGEGRPFPANLEKHLVAVAAERL